MRLRSGLILGSNNGNGSGPSPADMPQMDEENMAQENSSTKVNVGSPGGSGRRLVTLNLEHIHPTVPYLYNNSDSFPKINSQNDNPQPNPLLPDPDAVHNPFPEMPPFSDQGHSYYGEGSLYTNPGPSHFSENMNTAAYAGPSHYVEQNPSYAGPSQYPSAYTQPHQPTIYATHQATYQPPPLYTSPYPQASSSSTHYLPAASYHSPEDSPWSPGTSLDATARKRRASETGAAFGLDNFRLDRSYPDKLESELEEMGGGDRDLGEEGNEEGAGGQGREGKGRKRKRGKKGKRVDRNDGTWGNERDRKDRNGNGNGNGNMCGQGERRQDVRS